MTDPLPRIVPLPDGGEIVVEPTQRVVVVMRREAAGPRVWRWTLDVASNDPYLWADAGCGVAALGEDEVGIFTVACDYGGFPEPGTERTWVLDLATGGVRRREPDTTPYEAARAARPASTAASTPRSPEHRSAPAPMARRDEAPLRAPRSLGHAGPEVVVDGWRYVLSVPYLECGPAKVQGPPRWHVKLPGPGRSGTLEDGGPDELLVTLTYDPDPPSAADAHELRPGRLAQRLLRVRKQDGAILEEVETVESLDG